MITTTTTVQHIALIVTKLVVVQDPTSTTIHIPVMQQSGRFTTVSGHKQLWRGHDITVAIVAVQLLCRSVFLIRMVVVVVSVVSQRSR